MSDLDANCIFCKIISKEIPSTIVYENEFCIAFKDINPTAPCHLLVIPKKHYKSILDIDVKYSSMLISTIQELSLKLSIEDFRVVFNTGAKAGQSVFHIHAHFIAGRSMEWPPG